MYPKKKTVSLFIVLILISVIVSGQTSLGIFAGLNSGKLKGDAPPDGFYKSLNGMNVGAFIDVGLGKIVSLSLQPSYSQEGVRIFYQASKCEKPVDSLRVRLNYFSLPLLVKINSTNKRFYALAGIETGLLLSSYLQTSDNKEDLNADIADINFAMVFGAGFNIPLKYGRIFIELRYTQGLVNLTDEPLEQSYIPRVKTSGLKFFAGYHIPLSKNKK